MIIFSQRSGIFNGHLGDISVFRCLVLSQKGGLSIIDVSFLILFKISFIRFKIKKQVVTLYNFWATCRQPVGRLWTLWELAWFPETSVETIAECACSIKFPCFFPQSFLPELARKTTKFFKQWLMRFSEIASALKLFVSINLKS